MVVAQIGLQYSTVIKGKESQEKAHMDSLAYLLQYLLLHLVVLQQELA